MLGVFTFSDGGEPQGHTAVAAAGVKLAEKFKFNNSALFASNLDELTRQFFALGESNFHRFIDYINERDALPISLNVTRQLLELRKQKIIAMHQAKLASQQITSYLSDIAAELVDT